MAKRRDFNVFSLSFLDIMSCGFGAVILILIIINHATETTTQEVNAQLLAEITRIEEQVEEGKENLIVLRNTRDEKEDEIVTTEELALKIIETIQQMEAELALLTQDGASQDETIAQLKSELQELEDPSELDLEQLPSVSVEPHRPMKSPSEVHFQLVRLMQTAQAVKMNSVYMDSICTLPTGALYEKAIKNGVPYNTWYAWIENELNAAYIGKLYQSPQSPSNKSIGRFFRF